MPGGLLERETETAVLAAAMRAAAAGRGALVVVDGRAGIGKTALIGLSASLAERDGVAVTGAHGGVLERHYTLGVARQLLGPLLAAADGSERASLLRGPAERAWTMLEGAGPGSPDEGMLFYGLYWLVVNACEGGPRALLVDDAHWADASSLRFLVFLARRLEGLPLALVVAARPGEPGTQQELLEDLAAITRATLHATAAELLRAAAADPERVASHLLLATPSGSLANVDVLRAAARRARSRGSPQTAAAYLRRALDEPPAGAARAAVLRELGAVEAVLRVPEAATHLESALAETRDTGERALVARDLANVLMFGGRSERAEAILEAAIAELGSEHEDLALRLETMWGSAKLDDHADPARIARLHRVARRDVPAALALRVHLAFRAAMRAEPAAEVRALLRRGWDGGRLLELETGDSPSMVFVMLAATWIEDLDWAVEVADAVLSDAQRRASVLAFASAGAYRAHAVLLRGDVAAAEADARAALAAAVEHRLDFTLAELELARRAGAPGTTALALRAAALAARGDQQIALLEESVATANGSQAALTRALVDVDLGAALRRAGRRRDAREPLRRSLDRASQCGAVRIADHARQELAATGARPRRERITGRDALTASERRIAENAAQGLTNRAIAERLFLTSKTVENHLGRIYLKLGIASRQELPAALGRALTGP